MQNVKEQVEKPGERESVSMVRVDARRVAVRRSPVVVEDVEFVVVAAVRASLAEEEFVDLGRLQVERLGEPVSASMVRVDASVVVASRSPVVVDAAR